MFHHQQPAAEGIRFFCQPIHSRLRASIYLWCSLWAAAARIISSIAYGLRVGAITILISMLPYKLLLPLLPSQGYQHQLFAIGLCILLTLLCYTVMFTTSKRQNKVMGKNGENLRIDDSAHRGNSG